MPNLANHLIRNRLKKIGRVEKTSNPVFSSNFNQSTWINEERRSAPARYIASMNLNLDLRQERCRLPSCDHRHHHLRHHHHASSSALARTQKHRLVGWETICTKSGMKRMKLFSLHYGKLAVTKPPQMDSSVTHW